MNNIRDALLKEYEKYPLLEITDLIKLIFQHVNGGNHLLASKEKAAQYLKEEYEQVEAKEDIPLYEDIGNNILRINLARFKHENLDINLLFYFFVQSAEIFEKNTKEMDRAFKELKSLIKEHLLPFTEQEVDEYLSWYKENDYPLLSHSETYKKNYNPHYRIIHTFYLNDLLEK